MIQLLSLLPFVGVGAPTLWASFTPEGEYGSVAISFEGAELGTDELVETEFALFDKDSRWKASSRSRGLSYWFKLSDESAEPILVEAAQLAGSGGMTYLWYPAPGQVVLGETPWLCVLKTKPVPASATQRSGQSAPWTVFP
ncbi:MAG: hypothetical protein JST35_04675 [Armatimonadetes bacterium]|nr:hypothetical protein [Armatimonadota bacterium]